MGGIGGADKSGNAGSSAKAADAAAKAAKAADAAAKAAKAADAAAKAAKAKGLVDFSKDVFEPAPKTSPTGPSPYADAGVTNGVAYAGAAAIKGREPKTGIEVEAFSASGKVGMQNEIQAGMARLGVSSDNGVHALRGEMMTAGAHLGTQNKDGSTGLNAGASATAVGIEASTGYSGNSVTVGVSAGLGWEGSIGLRDSDGDGRAEWCGRVSVGPVTVGACIE